MTRLLASCVLLVLPFATRAALAAGPLSDNGTSIATSEYSIDLFMGSVLAGNRVTGMGGAYVAIAEDVDGNLQNPAAPAVRPFYSVDQFDFWPGLGLTFPANSNNDFFNTGTQTNLRRSQSSTFVTPALNLQWGSLGFGWSAEINSYAIPSAVERDGQPVLFDVSLVTLHYQIADTYADGQLVVGLGLRTLDFDVGLQGSNGDEGTTQFASSGRGLEVGAVWRPHGQPFRLGLAARSSVETEPRFSRDLLPDENGDIVLTTEDGPFFLPNRVSLPWDVNVGVAFQFGARPFNFPWRSREKLAERHFLEARLDALQQEPLRQRRLLAASTEDEREHLQGAMEAEDERRAEELEQEADRAKQRLLDGFANMDRSYLLLSASLHIAGAVSNGVGVESFFGQTVNRSGRGTVFAPHFGAESEAWPDVLKLRVGTYLQPARIDSARHRVHATVGGDLRLFRWNVLGLWPDDFTWAVGANLDVAARYLTWGVTLTGWYPRPSSSPN